MVWVGWVCVCGVYYYLYGLLSELEGLGDCCLGGLVSAVAGLFADVVEDVEGR